MKLIAVLCCKNHFNGDRSWAKLAADRWRWRISSARPMASKNLKAASLQAAASGASRPKIEFFIPCRKIILIAPWAHNAHNIALLPEREQETGITLKMMFDLGYVEPGEVPQNPRLAKPPAVVVYSPFGEAPVAPDVVLFACQPRSAMLLNEAANRAGVAAGAPALGRPTCMALPASLQHGAIFSLGCIGNRVYTSLGEDQMYFVVRGQDLEVIADALEVVNSANAALNDYAIGQRRKLSTA